MSKHIKIKWLGHACFKVIYDDYAILFDPFQPGSVPGLKTVDEAVDLVICSHGHRDHGYAEAGKIRTPKVQNPFKISEIKCFHDNAGGALRGGNNIIVAEVDGLRIAHFGDLGCELTKKQLAEIGPLDVALIPVGGYYTIDAQGAKNLMDLIDPRIIIPMHFRDDEAGFGYEEIGTLNEFTMLFPEGDVVYYNEDSIEIDKNTKKQVAVLKYNK
jgi:L-ascorbate metabolism protein UlaG (beta-lactamase superfamily)